MLAVVMVHDRNVCACVRVWLCVSQASALRKVPGGYDKGMLAAFQGAVQSVRGGCQYTQHATCST